jgi:predicted PurR-regulated permease PerM
MKKLALGAWILAALALVFGVCLCLSASDHSLPERIVLAASIAFFLCSGAWHLLERKQAARGWRILTRVLTVLFFLVLIAACIFWLNARGDNEEQMINILEGIYGNDEDTGGSGEGGIIDALQNSGADR